MRHLRESTIGRRWKSRALRRVNRQRIEAHLKRQPPRWISAVLVATTLVVGGAAASASAEPSIEGLWSFNGGQVAIEAQPGGEYVGVVIAPMVFALCPHPEGQRMWTGMRLQSDGSYWGMHQWYLEPSCALNPMLGPTAWRLLEGPDESHFLRVCFGEPGTVQPTIEANGLSNKVTSPPCVDSALLATLSEIVVPSSEVQVQAFKQYVALPGVQKCLSKRKFMIHFRSRKSDPFQKAIVTLSGRAIAVTHHRGVFVATVNLRGLPPGPFTVKIRVTTAHGQHLSGSRTYHTCATRPHRRVMRGPLAG
jgi:hypothetical protein